MKTQDQIEAAVNKANQDLTSFDEVNALLVENPGVKALFGSVFNCYRELNLDTAIVKKNVLAKAWSDSGLMFNNIYEHQTYYATTKKFLLQEQEINLDNANEMVRLANDQLTGNEMREVLINLLGAIGSTLFKSKFRVPVANKNQLSDLIIVLHRIVGVEKFTLYEAGKAHSKVQYLNWHQNKTAEYEEIGTNLSVNQSLKFISVEMCAEHVKTLNNFLKAA